MFNLLLAAISSRNNMAIERFSLNEKIGTLFSFSLRSFASYVSKLISTGQRQENALLQTGEDQLYPRVLYQRDHPSVLIIHTA